VGRRLRFAASNTKKRVGSTCTSRKVSCLTFSHSTKCPARDGLYNRGNSRTHLAVRLCRLIASASVAMQSKKAMQEDLLLR